MVSKKPGGWKQRKRMRESDKEGKREQIYRERGSRTMQARKSKGQKERETSIKLSVRSESDNPYQLCWTRNNLITSGRPSNHHLSKQRENILQFRPELFPGIGFPFQSFFKARVLIFI